MQHTKSIQKKLLQFFVLEVTARSAADILDIQPNSAMLFYRKIRQVIAYHLELQADEIFESYFGGQRKGKHGRGAADKVAVFGILKCRSKVYTVIVFSTGNSVKKQPALSSCCFIQSTQPNFG